MKDIIRKYIVRTLHFFSNHEEKLDEKNGVILYNSSTKYFEFQNMIFNEINEYAYRKGLKVDRIILLSISDTVSQPSANDVQHFRIIANSDARFILSHEKGKIVAKVFIGEFLEVKDLEG